MSVELDLIDRVSTDHPFMPLDPQFYEAKARLRTLFRNAALTRILPGSGDSAAVTVIEANGRKVEVSI